MKPIIRTFVAATLFFSTVTAFASLVTAPGDIPGSTVIDFEAQPTLSNVPGPVQIGAAAGFDVTVDGQPNDGFYTNFDGWGLCENGSWAAPMTYISANNARPGTIRVSFNDGPVSTAAGFINHAPCDSPTLVINAYDAGMNLLETYDITADAVTPGGVNAGTFRGISRPSPDISYFEIVGGVPVLDDVTFNGTAVASADLSVTMTSDPDPIVSGGDQNLVYTIVVSNAGPSDATNVVATDVLPSVASLISTSGCQNDPIGVPDCQLGTIASGASATYTISVMLQRTSGTISNSVSVTSDTPDPDSDNNSATQATEASAIAIPTLDKLGLYFLMLTLAGFGWMRLRRS